MSVLFTVTYMIFAVPCLRAFNCPDEVIHVGKAIFRFLCVYIVPMSLVSVISNTSIALGSGKIGFIGLTVQTALTLLGGWLLQPLGIYFVISAFSVAEIVTFITVGILIKKSRNDIDRTLACSKKALKE